MAANRELTNLHCAKAAPGAQPYRLADKGGLYLLVTPAGGTLWRWKYRFEGKQKQMALGKYPDVSLAQARLLHAEARVKLASGIDPMSQRKEEKLAIRVSRAGKEKRRALTFEKLVRMWYAEKWRRGKNPRYAANVQRRLETDVIARLGRKDAAAITSADVVELTKAVDGRGARDIAKRNLQFIRKIYRWGKTNNYLARDVVNPAAEIDMQDILSNHTPVKFAHLTIAEVPELLRRMQDYSGNVLTRIAMELIALTFVRTGELIAAEWKEIDWKNRQWHLPAQHMKMKLPHIVPLSRQAITLLQRLRAISERTGRLFPDYNGGAGTMSNNTILKGMERMGYKGRMTGHGWRHIASTYLRGRGYDKYWVEMQLAHREGGVAGIYNEAEYLKQRTGMMQAWADALDEMRVAGAGSLRAA